MTALEAAALDVPTVAHAVGGLVDVVPVEFLVDRHDAFGYRDGVLRVLATDGRSIALRRAIEVLPKFTAERNAAMVRAVYERVLTESERASKPL